NWALRWLRRQLAPTPWIDKTKCVKCGRCHRGCPVKPAAINPQNDGSCVNHRTCIRCYCCHEFCPVDAIELRKSWVERIFHLTAIGTFGSRMLGKIVSWFK
ncbi:MAG: 4Fe-4S binding protein, partial [Lentisphaeria bacterium]|nr:4Fe-4S binding protein [Lentisphaeria bacterium]